MITPEEYQKKFNAWKRKTDQFKYQCFSTITFKNNGFDDEIENVAEMHKFGGGQHFIKPKELDNLLGSISNTEMELLKESVRAIAKLDSSYRAENYNQNEEDISSILCLPSLMRSLLSIRILLENGEKSKHVLDIGPGSGYFGLLAGLLGYKIISTDISSGYFCFQSYLYSQVLGEAQYELYDSGTNNDCRQAKKVIHIPVWEWSRANFQLPEKVAIVFANHMLNEMHRHSLLYLMELLEKNHEQHLVSIEGWGYGSRTNPRLLAQTQNIFKLYGYSHLSHQEIKGFHAIDILKKEGARDLKNIKGATSNISQNKEQMNDEAQRPAVYNKDTVRETYSERRPDDSLKGMLPSDAFKQLKDLYEKQCTYKRCDQEFVDSLGTASDSNRLFLKGMVPGEFV